MDETANTMTTTMTTVAAAGTSGTDAAGDALPARLDIGQDAPDFTLPAVMPDGTTAGITLSNVIAQGQRGILPQ